MPSPNAATAIGVDRLAAQDRAVSGRRELAAAVNAWQSSDSPLPSWLGLNEQLLTATLGEAAPTNDTPFDWSPVIRACDRFYCVSAGEADDCWPCTPLWYTRLTCTPSEFFWHDNITAGEFTLEVPSKSVRLAVSVQGTGLRLPSEWMSVITPGDRWRWAVSRPGSNLPPVRGAFDIVPKDADVAVVDGPILLDNFAAIGAAIEAEYFQAAYWSWQQLPWSSFTALDEFVAQRVMAYLFRKMAKRLQGPPLWMGEPEGIAAIQRSRQHLAAAWHAIGMPVHW